MSQTKSWNNHGSDVAGAALALGVPTVLSVRAAGTNGTSARTSSVPPGDSGVRGKRVSLGVFELDATGWQNDLPADELAAVELTSGSLIGGRYRLLELIGEGGMGQVWSALDELLFRPVAVKIAADVETAARLEREATITANIGSAHFPAIFDVGMEGGARYLVMEKLEGEDLAHRLAGTGRLDVAGCVKLAREAGTALDLVHARGAVHRDVSPGNLFYKRTPDGDVVMLIDFGVAQFQQDFAPKLTGPGLTLGCPEFIAPEQLMASSALDGRADLFSLAIVLYRSLLGELPFGDSLDPRKRHYAADTPARDRVLCVTPRMDPFFLRALAWAPRSRFARAVTMAAGFEQCLRDGP